MWSDDDEDDDAVVIAAALALQGELNLVNSTRGQNYLRRCDLHPTPRLGTAWESIREANNDQAYILTTGFDVATFNYILTEFEQEWDAKTIKRADVNSSGEPRPDRRSLSACGALALVLHYLNSTMPEYALQQIFAVTPSVCTRYISTGLTTLLAVLRRQPNAEIRWVRDAEEAEEFSSMIRLRHPRLDGGMCFVDGRNLPVAESRDEATQNAYYNGWTCSHYCSNVLAFAPNGRIIYASLNAPGSWHDAAVARSLYHKLLFQTPPGYYAITDTAFPRNDARMQGRIKAPLKKNDRRPRDLQAQGRVQEYRELLAFHSELVSARQAAEWGMRAFQGSFARLKLPLPADRHAYRSLVLETCARLHQLRTSLVGINQIRNVYERIWRDNDQAALLYDKFRTMLFKDISKNDRIARFYRIDTELWDVNVDYQ